ncbi:hypothetical protein Tco_1225136, partial [Tanacetum coccineum]
MRMGRDQVFIVNLHHDGIFSPRPLKYIQGDEKQITDINFEDNDVEEFLRLFRGFVDGLVPQTEDDALEDPDDANIYPSCKAKKVLH